MATDHHDIEIDGGIEIGSSGSGIEIGEGGYVPDPERDTAVLLDAFLDHLAETVRERSLPVELIAMIRVLHDDLQAGNAHLIDDEPSRHNLRLTLMPVAAYRTLLPRLGRRDALAAVRAAFVEPLYDTFRAGTLAMLDAAPDPFTTMVALSKSREEQAFGNTFTFDRPVDDGRNYLLDVHRCFYHDVLVANSTPELTPVMCAFDSSWIEAIDPDRHGFHFERSTTIGLGGTHCPFHFHRNTAGEEDGDLG